MRYIHNASVFTRCIFREYLKFFSSRFEAIIILLDSYGPAITVLSFVINLIITWVTFLYATTISNFLGKAGSKAVSKIAALLLAAIAVMMMRKGLFDTIAFFCAAKTT